MENQKGQKEKKEEEEKKEKEEEEFKIDVPFTRTLEKTIRKLPYRRRTGEVKLSMHFGQRKLLLSEIEFLTNCGGLSNLVVYAGSAPGIHIPLLSKYFPNHTFDLYDPAEFKISSSKQINIFTKPFTDELAFNYCNKGILFISDVRTDMYQNTDKWEEEIVENMKMQKKWVELMKPVMSMLKFRLPYFPGVTKYFSGRLYFQPWAGRTSSEMRLVTNGKEYSLYDHTEYEQIMFRHNLVTRMQKFDHEYKKIQGIDYCYDCRSEIHILSRYIDLNKIRGLIPNNIKNEYKLKEMIFEISKELNINLEKPPHFQYRDLSRKEREKLLGNIALSNAEQEKERKINKQEKEEIDDFIVGQVK